MTSPQVHPQVDKCPAPVDNRHELQDCERRVGIDAGPPAVYLRCDQGDDSERSRLKDIHKSKPQKRPVAPARGLSALDYA